MQETKRQAAAAPHVVEYFHDAADPYSHLCALVLPTLISRYDITLRVHLVGPPPDWAAPERAQLEAYASKDAERLAVRAGLRFSDPGAQPSADQVARANSKLAAAIDAATFPADAAKIGAALWQNLLDGAVVSEEHRLAEGSARREELGHYLGGTFHYAGEWYWGVDRLHYLESRLADLGARKPDSGDEPIFSPPVSPARKASAPSSATAPELHYYLSFRSPYTYIVADRAKALADAYGAELKLRFVLPMVMRGLPVPRMKGRYITQDTAREARRLGVPFGKIADPVGKPVERGYSILTWAREQGLGFEFCRAFLAGVWSQGVDAGSDAGMRQIVEAAGLDWDGARAQLNSDDWRVEAEANRAEMASLGIWGVPSFRVGDVITWGQDRLWLIEDELRKQSGLPVQGEG